jgi:hypothetical protein
MTGPYKEYQETFWGERDEECPQLSEANGLYVFSLRNGSNYEPNYVGITKTRTFRKEVFNSANVVKILHRLVPDRGTLCLHLLAKPKDTNIGFYRSHKKSLLWTEMFILLLCRRKNPEILNIVGRALLENCGIEGITYPAKGKREPIKTFRNALAIERFGMAAGNGRPRLRPIAGGGGVTAAEHAVDLPSASSNRLIGSDTPSLP